VPILADNALIDACRATARECKLFIAELPAGDPLISTLRESWQVCRRAMNATKYGSRSPAVTFLGCCFACDACADACELRPGERARRCAEAFRLCADVCWDLAVRPDGCTV
jgi:hypothetical protein